MIEPGEEPGPWFGRVKLLFLPACYLLFSIVARAYKFGAIALSPRAVLETTATALLLAAVVFPLLRCGGRLGRGAMAAVFALVFGVNLAGMLLAGTLGVPAGIRLIPLTPDLVFIRTTMQDGAVSGSLLKAAAMWLGSSIVVGAAWWRIARHVRAPRPAASGLALAGGAALAAVSVLLPVAARAGDRDTWVALLQSVAGGTSVQAPPRPDKLEFAETSLLGAPPGVTRPCLPNLHGWWWSSSGKQACRPRSAGRIAYRLKCPTFAPWRRSPSFRRSTCPQRRKAPSQSSAL
ncbi:MAG: hypothetical protein M5U25_16950 [Planctomycetota bacterium]|nr:hypothetical protein [Planctomycetota bacterium]